MGRNGVINIETPSKAYVLRDDDTSDGATAVDGHCIVLHDQSNTRVGVGKIICTEKGCTAAMGPYPTEAITTTTTSSPTPAPPPPQDSEGSTADPTAEVDPIVCDTDPCASGVATMLTTVSAMVFYSIFAL